MTGLHREADVWSPAAITGVAGMAVAINAGVFAAAWLAGWWPPGGALAAAFAVLAVALIAWACGHHAGSRTEPPTGPGGWQ